MESSGPDVKDSRIWYQRALDAIIANEVRLNDWERRFIYGEEGQEGVKRRIEMGLMLTDGQEQTMIKIHMKVTQVRKIWR